MTQGQPGCGTMRCRKCGKAMYREDIDMGEGPLEAWHCPDRLDGQHGEWLSMPVFITRVSAEEYDWICEQIGLVSDEPVTGD